MTSLQLTNLNINLRPSNITLTELSTNNDIRNKLVYFFYQLKNNHDKHTQGFSVCPVKITWTIVNPSSIGLLNFNSNDTISGILAVELYKYILRTLDSSYFITYINEAFRIDNLFKKQAYRYFKEKKTCDKQLIVNYNKYYFMQDTRFIGNR